MIPDIISYGSASPGAIAALPWLSLIFLLSYLLGSIPFGILIAKYLNLSDPRSIGSGNIGATNVLRTGNKLAALMTLILDGGKGLVAVLIVDSLFGLTASQFSAIGAFFGHIFPLYTKFKGGKGVATFFGILLGFDLSLAVITIVIWLFIAATLRFSSLAALLSTTSSIIVCVWIGNYSSIWVLILIVLFIWLKHVRNLSRLLQGNEPKINLKSPN